MNKQTSKILGTALAITLAGGALYGGIKLVQNWDTVKNNTKDFIHDVTSKKEIDDLKAKVAELELKLETANADKATLTTEVTELKVKVENANRKVAELEASADATAEELAQARADAEALQSQLATKENELASAQVRITELENQLAQQNEYQVVKATFENFNFNDENDCLAFAVSTEEGTSSSMLGEAIKNLTLGSFTMDVMEKYKIYDANGGEVSAAITCVSNIRLAEDATVTFNYIDADGAPIDIATLDNETYYVIQPTFNNFEFKDEVTIQNADVLFTLTPMVM